MQQAIPPVDCVQGAFFSCVEQHVLDVAEVWFARGMGIAETIFFVLLTLELVVSGYNALRKSGDPGDVLKLALAKVLVLGFIWLLLKTATTWMGVSLLEFPVQVPQGAAQELTQGPNLTPGKIIWLGMSLFGEIFKHLPAPGGHWMQAITGLPAYMTGLAVCLIGGVVVAGSYIKLAIDLLKATIECYFSVGAGIVLAGFLSFRGTAPLGEGILRYVVTSALKLFFLLLVVYFMYQVGHGLLDTLNQFGGDWMSAPTPMQTTTVSIGLLNTFFAMITLAFLTLGLSTLPDRLAQSITQGFTINIKRFLENL